MASLQARHPLVDAFLTGVLAVADGLALHRALHGRLARVWRVGLPAAQALAVFAALGPGHGAALPGGQPGAGAWRARCRAPAPGWTTFRRLMAFPMFATVVWLVWVLGQQSGIDGAGALLALLVLLALVVWALTLRGRGPAGACYVFDSGLRAVGAGAVGQNVVKPWPTPAPAPAPPPAALAALGAGPGGRSWRPGQPVFVDFTAAWCVTCQYNKKTTLANADVLADFDAKNVALLRADWTRRDPAITAALSAAGPQRRAGVCALQARPARRWCCRRSCAWTRSAPALAAL